MKAKIIEKTKLDKLKKLNHYLSQEDIARDLGTSMHTVHRWLSGKSNPSRLAIPLIDKVISKYEKTILSK